MKFRDEVVFLTGASAGIGRDLALQLAAQGAKLALFARRKDLMDQVVREIEEKGGVARSYVLDVSSRDDTLAAMRRAAQDLGPCDLLIANAGVSYPIKVEKFDSAKAEALMKVNFLGVLHALDAVLPEMIQRRKGHVVAVSSIASIKSFPFSHVYCASKAALNAQLEGRRLDLRPFHIDVTNVLPGFIRTDMTARLGHAMPMLMDSDKAARKILGAIKRRRKFYPFPWPMYFLAKVARIVPDFVLARFSYE